MAATSEQRPQVNIRQATKDDIEGVLAIDKKITGTDRAVTYSYTPGSYVGGQLEVSVVAEAGGEIVGFLLGQMTDSPERLGDTVLVRLIGVDPRYQHQGIGTKLVQAFTELCRRKGVQSVRIMVSWYDWWLLSFLSSLGFVRGEMCEFIKTIKD